MKTNYYRLPHDDHGSIFSKSLHGISHISRENIALTSSITFSYYFLWFTSKGRWYGKTLSMGIPTSPEKCILLYVAQDP